MSDIASDASPRPSPTVPTWDSEERASKREELEDILLRRKKLSTVALFIKVMNELDSDWKSDQVLVKRTKKWAERAATY